MEKTYQRIARHFKKLILGLAGGFILSSALWAYAAEAQEIKLISDEETETFLADIVKPLFKAAGVKFYRNNIFIVEDNSLNAFVSDGNRLFVHTGTLIKADNANEISGVLAHETGHIMGGHILRQKLKNQDMREVTLISAILAGTTAALSGRGDMAMAVLLGGQSSALTHYTKYRANEERAADESAAKLLNQTGQSSQGLLTFMKKITLDNQLNGREETPYFRTHPVTKERISFFEKVMSTSPYSAATPLDERFVRIKAKLKSYLQPPEQTLRDYPLSRNDIPAQYAQAIAFMKQLKFAQALQKMDNLLAAEPDNPFFYELKGQILLETGKIKAAKQNFAKAYSLLPNSHLMQINYAQAILEDNPSRQQAKQAVTLLNQSLIRSQSSFAFLLLAKAYGILGDMAAANYASAEYSFRIGNIAAARHQLKEALRYNAPQQLKLKIDDLNLRLKQLDKE